MVWPWGKKVTIVDMSCENFPQGHLAGSLSSLVESCLMVIVPAQLPSIVTFGNSNHEGGHHNSARFWLSYLPLCLHSPKLTVRPWKRAGSQKGAKDRLPAINFQVLLFVSGRVEFTHLGRGRKFHEPTGITPSVAHPPPKPWLQCWASRLVGFSVNVYKRHSDTPEVLWSWDVFLKKKTENQKHYV